MAERLNMKRYRFFVEMTGVGVDETDAWLEAVEGFADDPGLPSRTELDHDQNDLPEIIDGDE